MEHSKIPINKQFYTMHLMTSIKQVISAKEARGEVIKQSAGSQHQTKIHVIVESKTVDDILMEDMMKDTVKAIGNAAKLAG